ncbi:MAG: hypothetical protein A2W35_00265 [Chloroflexi bacterium RBG_16_57_11]|nr:MAG: hypothetical protein A2W35_00265 [Chloroflexi bacterium RBG_16_57_11]
MIISASRRTDIPAFYAPWFINRIRAGFCEVPNPFNRGQITHISLLPEDVDVIVFWTRNPRPLFPYLGELEARGYRYYFQYTLLGYPPEIDANGPAAQASLVTFRELAQRVGPDRVIWRYDPIVLSQITPPAYHRLAFARLAVELAGFTRRSVISLMDDYPKIRGRLQEMARQGAQLLPFSMDGAVIEGEMPVRLDDLLKELAAIARSHHMEMVSCAEDSDLQPYGILPGKCVDDQLIERLFGIQVSHTKDPGQRSACGCVVSKDIGMYDSCLFGCRYCYATTSFARARANYLRHDPEAPSLYS